jgi:methionyl-tRNA formyltransferase
MQSEDSSPVRTVLVTQNDNFYLPRYIDGILAPGNTGIVAIVVLPSFSTFSSMLRHTFALFGPILFVYLGTKHLLLMIVDHFSRFLKLPSRFSVQGIARKHSVSCYPIRTINSTDGLSLMKRINPEVIFSLAAPQKFRTELLSIPSLGCYNIHSAMLPKYRGIFGIFWAMAHGEQVTGFTIHKMDLDLDTGPIAMQKEVRISSTDSYDAACKNLISEAVPEILAFLQTLSRLRNELPLREIPEDTLRNSRYYTFPTAEDRRQFRRLGKKFFRYL